MEGDGGEDVEGEGVREGLEGVGEEDEPARKKTRNDSHKEEEGRYSDHTDSDLRKEMKKRKFKGSGRSREKIILLLEEDDKTQRVINWANQPLEHLGQAELLGGIRRRRGGGGMPRPLTGRKRRICGRMWNNQSRGPME